MPQRTDTSVSRRMAVSMGDDLSVRIPQAPNVDSIANLHRGKLSWEIAYKKSGTFDPDSFKMLLWDIALLVFVLYDAWVVSLLVFFSKINHDICSHSWLTGAAMLFEMAFLVDIYVQMHTGYYHYGNLIRSMSRTRRRYLLSWHLPLDLFALFPVSFFVSTESCGLALVNKLLRLRKIPTYTLKFDKVFARYFKFCKVVKVIMASYMFCHVTAGLYVAFGKSVDHEQDDVWKNHDNAKPGVFQLPTEYFAALFWSLGLVSKCVEGELPRTLWQTLFMLVFMLGGFLLFVYICGTLFMISKCDTNSLERFDAKINQLRHVLSFHNVPLEIQHRAIEYLENGFKSGEANDRLTVRLFCPSIAKDVKFMFLKNMVASVPFFRCCSAAFVRAVVDLMETQSLPTNTTVCKAGDAGGDMYFVQSGVLAVMIKGIKVRELRKGGFFGELSIFSSLVRTADVTTATFTILHKLSRSHVQRVMQSYPQFEPQIMSCVQSLMEVIGAENNILARRYSLLKAESIARRAQAYSNFLRPSLLRRLSKESMTEQVAPDVVPPVSRRKSTTLEILSSVIGPSASLHLPKARSRYDWKRILLSVAIDRKSHVRLVWLICVTMTTIYNVFTVPLLNAFDLMGYPLYVLLLNMLADIILWLDIYGNLNLSFMHEGEQIMNTSKCARQYIRTLFPFDLICAFPWWILYPPIQLSIRCVRLLRIYRLGDELNEISTFIRINSQRRLAVLGVGLFLCYHIAGCMSQSLTLIMGYGTTVHGWLPPKSLQLVQVFSNSTGELIGYDWMNGEKVVGIDDPFVTTIIIKQYLRALQYGAVCLTNLGRTLEPEILVEYILASVLMLCGMLLISAIIDEVQKRVTASAIEQMEFLSTRARILRFLHKQNAPVNMHRRVSSYLDFWWSAHRGADFNDLVGELPMTMQHEIFGSICASILHAIEKMDGMTIQFEHVSKLFLDNLTIQLYGQGETICRKGYYADALYILLVGDVVMISNSRASKGGSMRFIKSGEIFGCASLQTDNDFVVHNENAVARTACVVASLKRSGVLSLNLAFPNFCRNLLMREQKALTEHRAMMRLLEEKELAAMKRNENPGTLDPDSNFSLTWETCLCFAIVVQTTSVPYFMAFGFVTNHFGEYDYISIVMEVFFLVDIALKTRTGYYSYGNKVRDKSKILHRYLRSNNFVVDILSILPINLVNIYERKRSETWNVNKLLRLFKLSSQIEHLERHYFKLNIQIRILKLVFFIFLLAHYCGCAWYNFASNASSILEASEESHFGSDEWLPGEDMDLSNKNITNVTKYTRVMFWGLGLLLGFYKGEYPTTPTEYIFTMIVQTIGVFLLAYVVGNLLDIVEAIDGNSRHFYSNLNYVRKLTKYFKFTNDMKLKIQDFYFYRLFHSIHEEHVLTKCLPPSLVADIRLFLLTPMLKKVPFFQDENATSSVTRSLVGHMSQVLVTRHEVICRQDEVGIEMFFVFTGTLAVYIATERKNAYGFHDLEARHKGDKVNEIHAGSFFGEKSLFSDRPRNASIVAKTFCTLYRLSRTHLHTVFAHHPEWKTKVMEIARAIYQQQDNKMSQNDQPLGEIFSMGRSFNRGRSLTHSLNTSRLSRRDTPTSLVESSTAPSLILRIKEMHTAIQVDSRLYHIHMIVLCTAMVYVALRVPYVLTFGHANQTMTASIVTQIVDVVSDLVYAYDIWFKLHIIETDASREFYEHRPHLDSTNLTLDILAVLPVDYVFSSLSTFGPILRFNRFIKLRHLSHTVGEIHRFSMHYEVNRLKLLALYYALICYWTACAYFGLTFIDGFSSEWNSSLPVAYFDSANPANDFAFTVHQTLRCLFFSATMYARTGIVYEPTTVLQHMFLFVINVFGVFVMGYAIGEGSSLSIFLIQNEVDFKINQMKIMEFLVRKRVDRTLRDRVHNYLAYWWSYQEGVTHQTTLEQLPPRIRAQAFVEIARVSLSHFALRYLRPLVHNTPTGVDAVIHSIAHRLVFEGYPAGESVIVQGNIGHTMYFVSRGTLVSASTTPSHVTARYETGQFFGEEGILADTFCRHSVVTLRACDLLALSASDFITALHEHRRMVECCVVATAFAAHEYPLPRPENDAWVVGTRVCQIMEEKAAELAVLQATAPDVAEAMFGPFLRLFVKPTGAVQAAASAVPTMTDAASLEKCHRCEENPATHYCPVCPQNLCLVCSTFVHRGTFFATHEPSIIAMKPQPLKKVPSFSRFQTSRRSLTSRSSQVAPLTVGHSRVRLSVDSAVSFHSESVDDDSGQSMMLLRRLMINHMPGHYIHEDHGSRRRNSKRQRHQGFLARRRNSIGVVHRTASHAAEAREE
ncbi:Aste57867_22655 [Aphanomyces stellatus]|uniref:Aste57867_22655 protein n=1 Tax=Aphanomyces stellatus TaxID=120398 RepID=A0A485LLU3_9STRA|nr:hypothetical protein As57867_022585 [Aphanomyces stellatus]VFT99309.1 Aste57867_22655 [Aphanomyces stellatus]